MNAGVIEPGHFRFSTAGEPILNLEVRLGYVHRGVERSLEGCTLNRALRLVERISGDNGVAHALAFCQAVEMANPVPERAQLLRCIFAEMERIYNHLGDIGGMATDVAFAVPADADWAAMVLAERATDPADLLTNQGAHALLEALEADSRSEYIRHGPSARI